MNGGGFPSNLPILDGKNWERWSASMRSLMGAQEVFEIVQDGYEQLAANPTERQQTTFKDSTSKEAWEILVKYYTGGEKAKKVKLQMLRRQYELLQMEEDEAVADYFNRVQVVVNQMRTNGESLTKVVIIEKILRTLTQSYDHIVVPIEESKDLDKMKVEDFQGSLEAHELRVRERCAATSTSQVQALQAQECRSKKVQREDDDEAQMTAEDSDSDEVLLMATTKSDDDCLEQWYLDTGCPNHMTGHKEWFVIIDDKVKREIRFADNSSVTAEGIGKILIQRRDGKQSFICDVLYVSNMKNNLLRLGQLLEKGYSLKMEQGEMRLFDDSRRLILKAPLSKNRNFKIDIQINESKCLAVEVMNEDWLWHKRFGHLNFRNLQMLHNKKMAKQHRNSIKAEVPTRSSRMMKIIYSDVCGPFEEVSIGDGELTHFALLAESQPVSDEEALSDPRWRATMDEELKSIEKNET
ncbi:uncharacterized protein [Cicer arietinum]|uniref:uncharacterized protein n=1 Tax=Cicer arietinum TaxID=3827 RepID=UPI003CC5B13F